MFRHPSRGRRTLVAAVFGALLSLLLPSAHASAAISPHWSLKLRDTFSQGIPSWRWGKYTGTPSSTHYSIWSATHVIPYRGAALLRAYQDGSRYVTGGMMLNSVPQTYGKYVIRAKFDRSSYVQHAMLLWPTTGWPPEVDFSEGPTSRGIMATSHWGSSNYQLHAFKQVDMRLWHTYGVEWTPTELRYTVDGAVWARMRGAAVPHQPMKLAIQTVATSAPTSTREVRMTVDEVAVWRWVG